jgi:hypothetical protein
MYNKNSILQRLFHKLDEVNSFRLSGYVTAMGKARTELMLAYVGGLGLSAIRVWTDKTGETPCWLTCETEPAVVEADGPRVMFDTLWFSKASHAELVLAACPQGRIDLSASEVRDQLTGIAASLGAEWRSTAQIIESAEKAVEEIEQHVKALNASGGLAPLNAGYKKYRLAMQATGEPAMNYAAHLLSFKLKMAKLIAENVAAGVDKFAGLK